MTLTRTVAYDRSDDVLVVWDRLTAGTEVRASQQWGLGRDRGVRVDADAVHTTGPGANVSLLFTSGGAPLDVEAARTFYALGWFIPLADSNNRLVRPQLQAPAPFL